MSPHAAQPSAQPTGREVWSGVTGNGICDAFRACGTTKTTQVKIRKEAAANLPTPSERGFWEPQLYKLVGGTRYKFIVEYNTGKYCELKLKSKNGKKFQVREACAQKGGRGGGILSIWCLRLTDTKYF